MLKFYLVKKRAQPYRIDAVLRACDVLAAFRRDDELLQLKDVVARTGISNATAFRIVRTLQERGFVEKVGARHYRSKVHFARRGRYRFGYASQGEDSTFSQEWSESIINEARQQGVDLIAVNNGTDAETAIRNVETFIQERVDLVIEHQFNEHIAPVISARLLDAGIPLIAMGTVHPGAIYFGGNNYLAGLLGGRHLGQWAKREWNGAFDELILLELSFGGPLLQARMTGVEAGVREVLPSFLAGRVVKLRGTGQFGSTLDLMRKHLRHATARRILVGAANDPCALGALRALEESGWGEDCAVMGQGGSFEGRAELRREATRLIGTVAFFPEKYGEGIMRLALDLLEKRPVPPAVFAKHKVLTSANVEHHYPNDCLLQR